jgi:peptidoglycan/LPS O-acetylase OafA/YrhL
MSRLRLELPAPLSGRIAILDELKGLAIIMIILYHAGGLLGWNDVYHGELGVDIFVVLSGVGLTLSTKAEGTGRFLLRRFWRIYPTYWIVLTACLWAASHFMNRSFSATDIALHYAGLHGWFGDAYAMSISDSFWFITFIVTLYAVFAPLRRLTGRPDLLLFVGAVVSLVPIFIYFHLGQAAVFRHLALRIPGFFLGLLIGDLLRRGSVEVPLSGWFAAAFFLLFYGCYIQGILIVTGFIALTIMAAYAFLARTRVGEVVRKDLRFLGDRSLEIFLIHQPLIREYNVLFIQTHFPSTKLTAGVLTLGMGVGVVVTLVLASLLHYGVGKLPFPWGRTPTAAAA